MPLLHSSSAVKALYAHRLPVAPEHPACDTVLYHSNCVDSLIHSAEELHRLTPPAWVDSGVNSGLTTCFARNPKPLIQVEPKMLIDQKNKKAFATGGDILLANGQKIPLPGGFALPTTGLWSNLLDIPVVSSCSAPACNQASIRCQL